MSSIVKNHFAQARTYRMSHRIGQYTIDETLKNCFDQYHGVVSPYEQELMDRWGVNLKISMTKNKVDVLEAWIRNLIQQSSDSPFVVSPTPIPDLSDADREEIALKIIEDFRGEQPVTITSENNEIREYSFKVAELYKQDIQMRAEERAQAMQAVINDQLEQGKFRTQYYSFIRNFILYPYAILYGPVLENKAYLEWSGEKLKNVYKKTPVVRSISPFDYFWSPDTKVGGTGQYDIIRERVSKEYLLQCSKLKYWIKDNVKDAIKDFNRLAQYTYDFPFYVSPDDNNYGLIGKSELTNDSVTILRYFGKISGAVLKQYGIDGVDDNDYREIEAIILGEYTLRLRVREEPIAAGRPIYVSSYTKSSDGVAGSGIAQVIRPFEQGYMMALRSALVNGAFSSAPTGELDASRVSEYSTDVQLAPGQVNLVSPSLSNSSEPAYRLYTIPNNTGSFVQLAQYWQQQADQYSGLPAALSGQPVGTGVNRTFRGVAQLYNNALQGVQSAFTNLDIDILERLGTNYYINNMLYNDDESIKGDSIVKSRGMAGLLQKEIDRQKNLDALSLIPALKDAIPPTVLNELIKKAFTNNYVSEVDWDRGVAKMELQQEEQQALENQMLQQQALENQPQYQNNSNYQAPQAPQVQLLGNMQNA